MNFEERNKKIKEQIIDTPEGWMWMELLFATFKDLTHYYTLLDKEGERTAFKQIVDRKTKKLRWQTPEEHKRAVTNYYSDLRYSLRDRKEAIEWIVEYNDSCRLCCWLADIDKEDLFKCVRDREFAKEVFNNIDNYFRTLRRGLNNDNTEQHD